MKKIIAGLIAFTMLTGVAYTDNSVISEMADSILVSADEFTLENGLIYTIVEETNEITIIGCDENVTEIEIPPAIGGLPVTIIDNQAFSGSLLSKVTIPDSVVKIGASAFADSKSLTSVTFSDSVKLIEGYAFYGCDLLSEITIPNSVTEISFYAFSECTSLNKVTIPDSVVKIGSYAFDNTEILNNQESELKYVDNWLVQCNNTEIENAEIEYGTRGIANGVFYSCELLETVDIPNSVLYIGDNSFENCIALTEVVIPDSVINIGENAFIYCSSLTDVVILGPVKSIGESAFGYHLGNNYDIFKVENFTIYGVEGSAAETYAIENGFIFVGLGSEPTDKIGDLDGDGEITANDALNVLQLTVGAVELTDKHKAIADVDGDREITSSDALKILQTVVGI